MVSIKSRCCDCGEVVLSLEDIMLVEHGDGEGTFYTFRCGTCCKFQAYRADARFIDFMRMNEMHPIILNTPIEYKEAEDAPPLSWDDLLDLHLQLQEDG